VDGSEGGVMNVGGAPNLVVERALNSDAKFGALSPVNHHERRVNIARGCLTAIAGDIVAPKYSHSE